MPMDRLRRATAGLGLAALLITSGGCRSTRSEVPPGRSFNPEAAPTTPPPVGFSTSPGSSPYSALPGTPGSGDGAGQYGTPAGATSPYGAPTTNSFGPPGTSGLSTGVPTAAPNSGYNPSTTIPQTGGTSPFGPAPAPGTMGTPGQPPSPL